MRSINRKHEQPSYTYCNLLLSKRIQLGFCPQNKNEPFFVVEDVGFPCRHSMVWLWQVRTVSGNGTYCDHSNVTGNAANGGQPQGAKLGPVLLTVFVNSLLTDWRGRIKFRSSVV